MNSYSSLVSAIFVILNNPEQRVCVKFCVKLRKLTTEKLRWLIEHLKRKEWLNLTFLKDKSFIDNREENNDDSHALTSNNVEIVDISSKNYLIQFDEW